MKAIWTVARREVRALLDHPTGYILLIVFVAVNNFLFFQQAYLLGSASLRPMLDLLPWILLFLVPAVTMRTVAEDTRTGTIEVVLAQPITELELLTGKYLGAVVFLWIALALTLAVPVGLSLGADLPLGVIVAQYVGSALLIAGLAGVGVWASALTSNQVTAFIVSVGVMFVLILVGLNPLLVGLPPTLGAIAARLGVLSHFGNIGNGVIDLRDVVYFGSLAAVFLVVAYGVLMGRRLALKSARHNRLRLGVMTLVAVVVVINLLGGAIRGRLDLTPGKAYTLSRPTRQILSGVDDLVTITLFASKKLPPQISLLKRAVDDFLRDIRRAGRGNVRIVELDPLEDEEAREKAVSLGIPPIQFNVVGQSELQISEGYMGLAIQYADEVETIPVISRSEDLEYRIASAVRAMTRSDTLVVGMMTGVGDNPMSPRTYEALRAQLRDRYELRSVSLPADSEPADDIDVLVIAGEPDSLPEAQLERLRAFFARGGGALIMVTGMTFDAQRPFAMPRPVSWNSLLEDFGVTVRSDMVYDLRSNQSVSLNTQFGRLFVPYPFWVQATSTGATVMNERISGLFFPWGSSLAVAPADSATVIPLFVSSAAGGVSAIPTYLDPQRQFDTDSLSSRLLAAAVVPPAAEEDGTAPGRVVLVGNEEFVTDRHARSAPANLVFALNAIDWLAQDEALIRIRSKNRQPPTLAMSEGKRNTVKYGNVIGIPLLIGLAAIGRLLQRRRTTRRTYRVAAAEQEEEG